MLQSVDGCRSSFLSYPHSQSLRLAVPAGRLSHKSRAQSLIFGMEPYLPHSGLGYDPRLIKGAGLTACRLCFYLFQDFSSFIGYVLRARESFGCLFSYSLHIPYFVFFDPRLTLTRHRTQ